MTIRTVIIGAAALVLSASSATAQGKPPQQVVLSQAVMKSMVASKPKSKIPLTARVGMIRQSRGAAAKAGQAAPTSVAEIRATPTKK